MNTLNNRNMSSKLKLIITFLVFPLLMSFALSSPASADIKQDYPQLHRELMDRYQDHEREMIIDKFEECLDVGVPPGSIAPMIERGVRTGINAQHMEMMLQEMITAAKSNLPQGPMTAKAMEGMVKHVEGQHIVKAMTTVRERMEIASRQVKRLDGLVLSDQDRNRMILDTMEAMASRMDKNHVQRVYGELEKKAANGQSKSAMREQAIGTVNSMKRISGYGVSSDRVTAVCEQVIRNNYTEKEIDHTMEVFSMARYKNWDMETVSRSVEKHISDGGRGYDMEHMNWSPGTYSQGHDSQGMGYDNNGDHGGMGGGGMGDDHDGNDGGMGDGHDGGDGGMGGDHGGMN